MKYINYLGDFTMKTMYDVRNILKRFGIFVYTGNRAGDLDMIYSEIKELYKLNLISLTTYQTATLIIRKESSHLNREK